MDRSLVVVQRVREQGIWCHCMLCGYLLGFRRHHIPGLWLHVYILCHWNHLQESNWRVWVDVAWRYESHGFHMGIWNGQFDTRLQRSSILQCQGLGLQSKARGLTVITHILIISMYVLPIYN